MTGAFLFQARTGWRAGPATLIAAFWFSSLGAATVPADLSGLAPGPVRVRLEEASLVGEWADENGRPLQAVFSLDPAQPLLQSLSLDGKTVLIQGRPFYHCEIGKRRGGWNAFFDFPPAHPEGTRHFQSEFKLRSAQARSQGERVELYFDGLRMGPFEGGIAYTIFPGSRLIRQTARVTTYEPDTAFYYDAGLEFSAPEDRRAGGNMETRFAFYDTGGKLQTETAWGLEPERIAERVRFRTLAVQSGTGALAVFPAPHQYFFPRDFTSNLGYVWRRAWRGRVALGIRQLRETNWIFYPWVNAPPGQTQELRVFFLVSGAGREAALADVLRYTHGDRFPALEGYQRVSAHWHLAYTVQALERGLDWVPPFKTVLKEMGVDASLIMDFHGDGHPRDLTELRLQELRAYYQACRRQSDPDFLLIPAEEANVHLGGHWALVFPRPVYWFMGRAEGTPFQEEHPEYGTVYRVGNADEMLELVRRENALVYQTHPRTKGSTGYPDKIRESAHFKDPRYLGAGWKAMPSDLSTPRLGERSLDLLDDMNNWDLPKKLLGEVDVFQFDSTHELYAHMNINYVRLGRLPDFDRYGEVLKALAEGEYFVSTGEIQLPEVGLEKAGSPDQIRVRADVRWTFPLEFAEIVWGDGSQTRRQRFSLQQTREFGSASFQWVAQAPGWKWARVAVWDTASNGAFANPFRKVSAPH